MGTATRLSSHVQGPEHAGHGDGRDGDDGDDDDRVRVGQVVHVVGIGVGTVEGATELTGQDGRVDEHEELEAAQDREGHDILGAAGVESNADLEQDGEDKQRDIFRLSLRVSISEYTFRDAQRGSDGQVATVSSFGSLAIKSVVERSPVFNRMVP